MPSTVCYCATSTGTGTTTGGDAWTTWNSTAATYLTTNIWSSWTTGTAGNSTPSSGFTFSPYRAPALTPEQKLEAERKQRQIDLKAKLKERRQKRVARQRARALLKSLLTAIEWSEYQRYGSVQVVGSLGGKYEVGGGTMGMVTQLDDDYNPIQKICYHPSTQYVVEDRVAAVILDIKCDESRVRTQGNKHSWCGDEQRKAKARRLHKRVVLCETA